MAVRELRTFEWLCDECGAQVEVRATYQQRPHGWQAVPLREPETTRWQHKDLCRMCAEKCECGHGRMSHPFGHSLNLSFTGSCALCGCVKYTERHDVALERR